MAGKFDGYSSGNSLMSRFVKSRIKRKNVGWARPTTNLNGGPCPPYVTRGILEQLESRVLLSAFTVTSLADDGGVNELRWAIQQANTVGGTNTINFKSGLSGTITLTEGVLGLSSGDTTITGPGASSLIVSGNNASRVFLIGPTVTSDISGLTIANGAIPGYSGGGIESNGNLTITNCIFTGNSAAHGGGVAGGAVITGCNFLMNSALGNNADGGGVSLGNGTITNCTFSDNSSTFEGGGVEIVSGGEGTIRNSTFTGNTATVAGGAVFSLGPTNISNCTMTGNSVGKGARNASFGGAISTNQTIASLNLTNCTITGNSAIGDGGGIFVGGGAATISGCAISDNTATSGGGIASVQSEDIINSTFYGNKANDGGAIWANSQSPIFVTNCTIAHNSASGGGGIWLSSLYDVTLYNTIVAMNTASDGVTPSDIAGSLDVKLASGMVDSSNNLIGSSTGLGGVTNGVNGNIIGVNAAQVNLGPLQNNGGPTETIALLPGSLAIDHGSNALALDSTGNPLTTDQRGTGFARIYNGTVDIGAFEYQPTPPKLVYHTQPGTTSAGSAINPAVVVYVEDSTGNILTSDNSAVTLSLLTGSLNGTVTVNAVNGIATFSNLLIYTAGTYTLHAADGTIPAINSNSFTVNPAAGAKLVFAAEPTNANAGAGLTPPVVVYEMDAFGNIVRTDTSKVNLSVETGPGAISGTASVALNNGAAIFSSVSFNTPGTYTLIAQDGSLASIVSTSFQIAATQAQYHLVFAAGPTNTAAGQVMNPSVVVYLMDSQNNIIRNDTSKVTLSVTTGPGTIAGTTSVAFNNGAAIFSNISFPTAGTYTITAKDGSFTSITSASFTISPVTTQVAHLVFVQNPTNIIAGKNIAPNITVKATDASGKVVGGVTVTLEISSGPTGGALFGKWTSTTYATGIAAFGATTLHLPGTYTLTASVGGVVSGQSTSFTVSPAAANKLAFTTLPTTASHGTAFTVKVSVEDTYGNVLTSQNTGTITLVMATHPTGSTLGGTLTANVVNGVATFSKLTASLAGSYSFKATDSFSIAAATSTAIVVS